MVKPIVAVTMGDPAGIGPEITLLAVHARKVREQARTVVIGDLARLREASRILAQIGRWKEHMPELRRIGRVGEAEYRDDVIDVLDLQNVPEDLPWGQVSREAGQAAFDYVAQAVELAVQHTVDAVVTAPINKEAWKLAGIKYPGHTEALAALCGASESAMMLVNQSLRVVHVTTHVSLRKAIEMVSTERVLERIRLTHHSLEQFGIRRPRIAVAGLNPHAGEGGLFGDEDECQIRPAVERAAMEGINCIGPLPPDSVYARAAGGEFDAVIAMYHDQGHIAIKMLGFDTGINVTLGLPILRTSVDHGTAFDIAGKGIAREDSMIASILVATEFLAGNMSQRA